ncbi:hypothetical protein J6590_034890 [Homalodisca vitripennis]|nr:hypothetical protein J6590_034890 [Homalodisca vitripennis]
MFVGGTKRQRIFPSILYGLYQISKKPILTLLKLQNSERSHIIVHVVDLQSRLCRSLHGEWRMAWCSWTTLSSYPDSRGALNLGPLSHYCTCYRLAEQAMQEPAWKMENDVLCVVLLDNPGLLS